MTAKHDGGSAFPHPEIQINQEDGGVRHVPGERGLSARAYIATHTLAGLLANPAAMSREKGSVFLHFADGNSLVGTALALADKMVTDLQQPQESEDES